MKSVAKDLTKEIAEKSIYDYLENTLGVSIVTSKRIMTVEKMTEIDEKYLDRKRSIGGTLVDLPIFLDN